MTTQKIREVVTLYRAGFEANKIPKQALYHKEADVTSKEELLAHAHYLLDGIEEYAKDPEKKGKTGRHLGTVQTILWVTGWYTLEQVKRHNKP